MNFSWKEKEEMVQPESKDWLTWQKLKPKQSKTKPRKQQCNGRNKPTLRGFKSQLYDLRVMWSGEVI